MAHLRSKDQETLLSMIPEEVSNRNSIEKSLKRMIRQGMTEPSPFQTRIDRALFLDEDRENPVGAFCIQLCHRVQSKSLLNSNSLAQYFAISSVIEPKCFACLSQQERPELVLRYAIWDPARVDDFDFIDAMISYMVYWFSGFQPAGFTFYVFVEAIDGAVKILDNLEHEPTITELDNDEGLVGRVQLPDNELEWGQKLGKPAEAQRADLTNSQALAVRAFWAAGSDFKRFVRLSWAEYNDHAANMKAKNSAHYQLIVQAHQALHLHFGLTSSNTRKSWPQEVEILLKSQDIKQFRFEKTDAFGRISEVMNAYPCLVLPPTDTCTCK